MRIGPLVLLSCLATFAIVRPSVAGQALEPTPFVPASNPAPESPHPYVQAAFGVNLKGAGIPNHRIKPAVSGTAIDVSVAAGAFVRPSLAVEGALSVGAALTTPQRFSYTWSEDYIVESRDTFLDANVRWRGERQIVELVAGGGFAFSAIAEQSIVRTDSFGLKSTLPDQIKRSIGLTFAVGIAVALPVSQRFQLIPTGSWRWVQRPADGTAAYLGVGASSLRIGVEARFKLSYLTEKGHRWAEPLKSLNLTDDDSGERTAP